MRPTLPILLLAALPAFGQFSNARLSNARLSNADAQAAQWSPSSEASLVAWYKADVGVTNTSAAAATDGQSVTGWQDQSGHNLWATNWTGGSYPTFVGSAQNSLPAVRFGATAITELRADPIYTSYVSGNDTPFIWAMAYRKNTVSLAGIWFQGIKSGGTPMFVRAEIDGSNRYFCTRNDGSVEKNVFVDWPVDLVGWHVAIWKCTGTTAEWLHDGVSLGSPQDVDVGQLDNNATDFFYIGRDNGGVYWNGDIGEILIFNSASVSTTSIQNYLQQRWNTPIDTPDTCTTIAFQNTVAQNDFTTPSSGATYFGVMNWTPAWPTNVCAFDLETILFAGTRYRASIWTDDGSGNLATQQGSGAFSDIVTGTSVHKVYKFSFNTTMALSAGTLYHLVISQETGTIGGTENIYQGGDTASYGTGVWNGAGALTGSSTRDPKFTVYQ